MSSKEENTDKVYVKLRDASGSWTSGSYKFGGNENIPQLVEKTPTIVRALQTKLLVVVPEKDAKKVIDSAKNSTAPIKGYKKDVEGDIAVYTKEELQATIEKDDYPSLIAAVRGLNIETGKGNISKADAVKLLENYLGTI